MDLTRGWLTWILAVTVGVVVMLGIEWAFHAADAVKVGPIAQGIAYVVASLVAWPYTHRQNVRLTFRRYVLLVATPMVIIAALRIAFRTG